MNDGIEKMNWKGKSVLVTGSGGFIGSHLVEALVGLSANVKAFVRYNSRNDWGLLELVSSEVKEGIEVVQGDLRDIDAVRMVVKDVDLIFHLGALISIPYSYVRPRETIETNVLGTLNVMLAAKEFNTSKIIHTSTSEVYGSARYTPINETHPLTGQSPYSASKIAADKVAESFQLSFDLHVTTIRPFNTYGPRQSARAIIPTIISQVLSNKKVIIGSTAPTRDFTYVADTVNGFIKIAESPNSIGKTINIGSNSEISIGALAEKIVALIDPTAEIEFDQRRVRPEKSEVQRLICDNTKAKEILGWEPEVTFEDGLKKTINWIKDNLGQYKSVLYNK